MDVSSYARNGAVRVEEGGREGGREGKRCIEGRVSERKVSGCWFVSRFFSFPLQLNANFSAGGKFTNERSAIRDFSEISKQVEVAGK